MLQVKTFIENKIKTSNFDDVDYFYDVMKDNLTDKQEHEICEYIGLYHAFYENYDEAKKYFNKILNENNNAYFHLGDIYCIEKKYAEAKDHYEKGRINNQMYGAMKLVFLSELTNNQKDVDIHMETIKDDVKLIHKLGEILMDNNIVSKSLKYYKFGASKKDKDCLYKLSEFYVGKYKLKLALKYAKIGLSLNDNRCEFIVGFVFDKMKKYDKAEQHYINALNVIHVEFAYRSLIKLLYKQKKYQLCDKYFMEATLYDYDLSDLLNKFNYL